MSARDQLRWIAARAVMGALATVAGCAHEPSSPVAMNRPESPSSLGGSPAAPSAVLQRGFATYYAARFTGLRTANGERYDPRKMTAAHRSLPFGTFIEVRRASGDAGRAVVVRINDRGPYGAGRVIDLSRRAAEELGIVSEGKVAVELRVVAPPAAATH